MIKIEVPLRERDDLAPLIHQQAFLRRCVMGAVIGAFVLCAVFAWALWEYTSGERGRRKRKKHGRDPLENLIVGDHLEAIGWLLKRNGPRGSYGDESRRRDVIR